MKFLNGLKPAQELTYNDVFMARTLTELADRAVVGIQSAAGYGEGRPQHESW